MEDGAHRFDKTLTRQHDHIGQHLSINAEAQNHASHQQCRHLNRIAVGIQTGKPYHRQIDEIAKEDGTRNLKQLDFLVFAAEQENLYDHQQQAEKDRELPQGGGEAQTQGVGNAGDGRSPQCRFGNEADTQGIDKQPHQKNQITLCSFHLMIRFLCEILIDLCKQLQKLPDLFRGQSFQRGGFTAGKELPHLYRSFPSAGSQVYILAFPVALPNLTPDKSGLLHSLQNTSDGGCFQTKDLTQCLLFTAIMFLKVIQYLGLSGQQSHLRCLPYHLFLKKGFGNKQQMVKALFHSVSSCRERPTCRKIFSVLNILARLLPSVNHT